MLLIGLRLQDKQSTRFYLHNVNVGILNKKGELVSIPDSNRVIGDTSTSIKVYHNLILICQTILINTQKQ